LQFKQENDFTNFPLGIQQLADYFTLSKFMKYVVRSAFNIKLAFAFFLKIS